MLLGHLSLLWMLSQYLEQPLLGETRAIQVIKVNTFSVPKSLQHDVPQELPNLRNFSMGDISNGAPQPGKRNSKADVIPASEEYRNHYFESRELTQKPLVIVDIPADFSLQISDALEQPLILRLLIGEYGDVDRVVIEDQSLPVYAKDALTEAFKSIKFHPGEIDDIPVKSQLKIIVRLNSTEMSR